MGLTMKDVVTVEEFLAADPFGASRPVGSLSPVQLRSRLEDVAFARKQRLIVVSNGGRPICRLAARISPHLEDGNGSPVGHVGFFESVNDPEAIEALRWAAGWLIAVGAGVVIGPLDSDTWHRYRLNAGPYERPSFPMEPWNPPYYAELWQSAGFELLESYSSKWVDDVGAIRPHLAKSVNRSAKLGYRIRPFDRDRIERELETIHQLSLRIFSDNPFFSPIDLKSFRRLYEGIESLLDPDLVVFGIAPNGEECGFVFAFAQPDLGVVNYKTIGVDVSHRRSGVAGALADHVYQKAVERGLCSGNHALMREGNASQGMDAGLGSEFRRYHLYRWSSR